MFEVQSLNRRSINPRRSYRKTDGHHFSPLKLLGKLRITQTFETLFTESKKEKGSMVHRTTTENYAIMRLLDHLNHKSHMSF